MKYFIVTIITAITLLFAGQTALAQGLNDAMGNLGDVGTKTGMDTEKSLSTIVGGVIQSGLSLLGLVFLVLMVYAGYLWMIARGDDAKVEKSKEIIKAAITGMIIVVSAYAITFFVVSKLE